MSRSKIILLLAYMSIAAVSAVIITPALPQIKQFYSISSGSLEWVISIFLMGYVAGQLIYGPIANRFGRLSALRLGLIINLFGILICISSSTFSSDFSILLIGRLVTALGSSSGLVCTFILLNELLSQDKAKVTMGYAILSFTFGIGIAITIGSLLTQYANWSDSFWILFLYGIFMLFGTWAFKEPLKNKQSIHPRTILSGYRHAFGNKILITFSMMAGIVTIYSYGYSATAAIYAQKTLQLSPSHYGYWSLLNTLGMTISGFLSAYLIRKMGLEKTLITGIIWIIPFLMILIYLCGFHHNSVPGFFVTTMFLYIGTGFLFPAASYFASNAIVDRASASGAMSFINMSMGTLGVIVIGYLPFESIVSFLLVFAIAFIVVSINTLHCLRRVHPSIHSN